jgi:hypothetical protein
MPAQFNVTSVVERPTLSQGGQLVNSTVLYLETLRGATGTVEIPTIQFMSLTGSEEGKAVLRQILQDKADSLEAPFEM